MSSNPSTEKKRARATESCHLNGFDLHFWETVPGNGVWQRRRQKDPGRRLSRHMAWSDHSWKERVKMIGLHVQKVAVG
jgi:hypothetical protein